MAGSRTPGPTRHDPFSKLVAARTPGPLGRNDAADPNALALLGDTSSPLGVNDHAEPFANKAGQDFPPPVSRQQVESIKKEFEVSSTYVHAINYADNWVFFELRGVAKTER